MMTNAISSQLALRPSSDSLQGGREAREATHERPVRHQRPRPGRAHLMQGLKHMVRDVRHAIQGELRELAESDNPDPAYSAAVQDLVKDFRDSLKDVFHAAGKGKTYDPKAVLEGVGQAMADLTAGLKALREARDGTVPPPVEQPVKDPQEPQPDVPAGLMLDAQA